MMEEEKEKKSQGHTRKTEAKTLILMKLTLQDYLCNIMNFSFILNCEGR